ncbi:lipopolysaccharide heptosyltransferase I [Immundisolibacter sp.]|uniref:lipopolysaccharide heptosyltransferase I n=1 Tax=Immundisolibacter sp. TaxID=1934948 RepID=UPI003F86E450
MKLLLVKTSSFGDVLHALPALTEAKARVPALECHWVVEEAYADVPTWHPAVTAVLPVAIRRWRRTPLAAWRSGELAAFRRRLRAQRYDCVLDAQGLLKTAPVTLLARGPRVGFDRRSAREGLASFVYDRAVPVDRRQHAVERLRALFAGALGYPVATVPPDYGIDRARLPEPPQQGAYLVFLHGSTWPSKLWPESHWRTLIARAGQAGLEVLLPYGDAAERQRAQALATGFTHARVLPPLGLAQLAATLAAAHGVVGVDSGPTHLACALGVPTLSLYGATDPQLTGTWGQRQQRAQARYPCAPCLRRTCRFAPEGPVHPPCYGQLDADTVWAQLEALRLAA